MNKLEIMLAELESSELVTILAPSKRAVNPMDSIRVNVSENCRWYKKFCALHISKRGTRRGKPDTICRRHNVIVALQRLLSGKKPTCRNHHRLIEFARTHKL